MKLTKVVNLLVIGLALSLTACGCKKNPQGVTKLPEAPKPYAGDTPPGNPLDGGGVGTTGVPQPDPAEWMNAKRDETIFQAYTVQFAYDSPVVRASEKSKVAAVADYMKANMATGVEIEGHCDERGTDQYNYSLGERRALAVRDELITLGISGNRILTKSFGRSRPIDTGHSDAAHARNRRGAFVLLTK